MGPTWIRRGDRGRSSCSGSRPTAPVLDRANTTATDTVAAEAADGIAALERMLADEALVLA